MATYYVDGDAGNNSYTGLKITGTIDSTASTTTFVDAALTGADDYINGSFFYNSTTGKITTITDFVASTDTATIGSADASMAAGDSYYILHAFLDLDQFTENARSAGDICIVRRGTTIDDGTDLNFTSDGTKADPISIKSDNANEWKDDVDLSATATATLTFGSKTWTFSADVSGVVAVGDVLYEVNDDADEFAYEVATVSTTTVTMFLPYKGGNAGATKTVTNMQGNPVWNTAAGSFQWNFVTDHCWKVQGIHIRGTDAQGNIELSASINHIFKDCVLEGNDAADKGIRLSDDPAVCEIRKCRFFNHIENIVSTTSSSGFGQAIVTNSLLDGNSIANSVGLSLARGDNISLIDCEFKGHSGSDIDITTTNSVSKVFLRNCLLSSGTQITVYAGNVDSFNRIFSEDHDGSVGVSAQYSDNSSGGGATIIDSDVGTVRSGGGAISGKVTPSIHLGTNWEFSRQLLFEIPFYVTTVSKQYDVYFRPTATADWTADPTAAELWIELEYWGHASNNFRRITKSTGVIDMNGSTSWAALSVTIAPAQAGVAYLRGYYAKTKESGKANTFFWDVVPVVT